MGKLERQVKKKRQRVNLKKIILGSVALAGILSIGMVAPNALGALAKLGILPHGRQKETILNSRTRLIRQGFLKYENGALTLTAKGEAALRRLELCEYRMKKPKRWDGLWRVLIFDIPEKRRKLRDQVRRMLSAMGFMRVQDSVWLYPYDCEDIVTLLKADFKIGKDLLYLVVERMEYDVAYRERFDLI
jgi:DNA-binding transcriptional regulator PaaX